MNDCLTCTEVPADEMGADDCCPESRRPCGHHCNCVWIQDCCHWCDGEFDEDGETWRVPLKAPALVAPEGGDR